jgi:hypothetical protein
VIMLSKETVKESIAWECLKNRQKVRNPESVKNLVPLAECVEQQINFQTKSIEAAYNDNEWRVSVSDFEAKHQGVVKLLKQMQLKQQRIQGE